MKKFQLKEQGKIVFLTAEQIAETCYVNISTAYRWIQRRKIPRHFRELLTFKHLGVIPRTNLIHRNGHIITRNGYHLNENEIESYSLVLKSIYHDTQYRHLINQAEAKNEKQFLLFDADDSLSEAG